jgi:hypothetical protein
MSVRPIVRSILHDEGIASVDYLHPVYNRSGQDISGTLQLRIGINPELGLVTAPLVAETCRPIDPVARLMGEANRVNYPYCGRTKCNHPKRDAIRFRRASLRHCPDMIKSASE